MTETKTGAELEPERGEKGSKTLRQFYGLFGIGTDEDE